MPGSEVGSTVKSRKHLTMDGSLIKSHTGVTQGEGDM